MPGQKLMASTMRHSQTNRLALLQSAQYIHISHKELGEKVAETFLNVTGLIPASISQEKDRLHVRFSADCLYEMFAVHTKYFVMTNCVRLTNSNCLVIAYKCTVQLIINVYSLIVYENSLCFYFSAHDIRAILVIVRKLRESFKYLFVFIINNVAKNLDSGKASMSTTFRFPESKSTS